MKRVLVICWILWSLTAKGQKVFSSYPFLFDQYSSAYNLINPAFASADRFQVQTGYNGLNQLSSKLSSYFLNTRFNLGEQKRHGVHFFIQSDQEGEFLVRHKVLGQYAYSTRLNEAWRIASGISLGMVQNVLRPNDVVGAESVIRPDLDLGAKLHNEKWTLGLSFNQIPNAEVLFFNGRYALKRYLTGIAQYKVRRGRTAWQSELFWRSGPELWNKLCAGSGLVYSDLFYLGLYYKLKNGLVPQLGLQNLKVGKSLLGLQFSYKYPLGSDLRSLANVELMVELRWN